MTNKTTQIKTNNKQTNKQAKKKEAYDISRNSRTVRRLSRKRRDAGKGKALLQRVRKHGELLLFAQLAHWNG